MEQSLNSLGKNQERIMLDDVFGQEDIAKRIKKIIVRSNDNNVRMSNMMFVGYDSGQAARLALAVANELGSRFKEIAYCVDTEGDIVRILTNLNPEDVLFINISKQKAKVIKILDLAIKIDAVNVRLGDDSARPSHRISLPSITYIIYCNKITDIPSNMQENIPEMFLLHELSKDEMVHAINKFCSLNNVSMSENSIINLSEQFHSWIQLEKYLLYLKRNVAGENGHINDKDIIDTGEYAKRLNIGSDYSLICETDKPIPIMKEQVWTFKEILSKAGTNLNQAASFRALLKDYFYKDALWSNLLFLAFDMGIVYKITHETVLDDSFIKNNAKQLVQEYGMKPNAAIWTVTMWVQCFGKGILGK